MRSGNSKHSGCELFLLKKLFPLLLRHLLNNRPTRRQSSHLPQTSHAQVQAAFCFVERKHQVKNFGKITSTERPEIRYKPLLIKQKGAVCAKLQPPLERS